MGRPSRSAEGGRTYHVLTRAGARLTPCEDDEDDEDDEDYQAFERVLTEAISRELSPMA